MTKLDKIIPVIIISTLLIIMTVVGFIAQSGALILIVLLVVALIAIVSIIELAFKLYEETI